MGGIPVKFRSTPFSKDEYQASSGLARKGTAWVGFVTGHDFSRAVERATLTRALAPEG